MSGNSGQAKMVKKSGNSSNITITQKSITLGGSTGLKIVLKCCATPLCTSLPPKKTFSNRPSKIFRSTSSHEPADLSSILLLSMLSPWWLLSKHLKGQLGHSGEYGNDAKLVGKTSKSVMQLISIHFLNWFSFLTMKKALSKLKILF